jgi:hypothetical protein
METLSVTFSGRTPLVVHNIRLANPLDAYAKALKAITSKRSKTEDDHLELLRIEWEGGLYFDEKHGPYLPISYPMACLKQAGAINRQKTAVNRGVTLMAEDGGERLAIEYDGPRTIDEMWEHDEHRDVRPVKVGTSRTLRSRPRFPEWAIRFVAIVDTEIIDVETFEGVARRAGRNIGLGESPEGARARFDAAVTIAAESALLVAA